MNLEAWALDKTCKSTYFDSEHCIMAFCLRLLSKGIVADTCAQGDVA